MVTLAFLLASSITDWISAVSTALLGLVALVVTLYQWWASGFRPRVTVERDIGSERLRITVSNRGRGSGTVERVAVAEASGLALEPPVEFAGLDGGYEPRTLPPRATMRLLVDRPGGAQFPLDTEIKVECLGKSIWKKPTPVDVSFAGLKSALPPEP